jgi:hypothetical protein
MDAQKYWSVIQNLIIEFGPKLLAALVIVVIAFIIGKFLAYAARYLIGKTAVGDNSDLGTAIGKALFWITILVALPAILGALGMDGLLKPMQEMSAKFLGFLPNLVGAGLIFGIGFIVAKIAKETITSVLHAAQIDTLAERYGFATAMGDAGSNVSKSTGASKTIEKKDKRVKSEDKIIDTDISSLESENSGLSGFFGLLVFTLLIIPIAIAALDTLGIEAISTPAKQMLQSVLDAIPNIFAATVVLGLAFLIGRFASQTLARLLPATGVDNVGEKLGLSKELSGNTSISKIAAALAFAAIMIFGVIEAAKLLDFAIVSNLMTEMLALGGRLLLGSVIIGFGVIAADFISDIVARSKDAKSLAPLLKIAIIVLASAMGLRQMGLANEIINMGFTLMIGALAVGAAIAIGMGGKDTAGRLLEKWTKDM